MKYLMLGLLAFIGINNTVKAASYASCKVTVFRESNSGRVVISTPNLPPYVSFSATTCNFLSDDGKLNLSTGVLVGGFNTSLSYDGVYVLKSSVALQENIRSSFSNTVLLPTGEQAIVECSALVSRRDATSRPECE